MSQWLKRRLIALFCAVTLCGGATYLHAQNSFPAPAATPEAAGEQFFALLATGEEEPRFQLAGGQYVSGVQYLGSLSRPQVEAMSSSGGLQSLLSLLVAQSKAPQFSARVSGREGDKTLVEVSPGASQKGREVVVVAEDGGYRVDLLATYGKWNNLSGAALDNSIYQLTGYASSSMQGDSNFVRSRCQSNLKQISLGIMQYIQDYDEKFPRARAWTDILQPYVKSRQIFTCPALPTGKIGGYAFNQNLSQFDQARIEGMSTTISVYETSNLGQNVFGPGTGRAYRHFGGANFAYADGHVKWTKQGNDAILNFKP